MEDDDNHLPHAGISTIFGLLEVLDDLSGREDIFKLAQSLQYELDDLLPVLESAELLDFVTLTKGDIKMTPLGKELVEADVDGRKAILRNQLLGHPIFREIIEAVNARKDRHLPRTDCLEMFEEHFSPEESEKQFSTVIDWGRYAELLGYNPDTEELYLSEDGD